MRITGLYRGKAFFTPYFFTSIFMAARAIPYPAFNNTCFISFEWLPYYISHLDSIQNAEISYNFDEKPFRIKYYYPWIVNNKDIYSETFSLDDIVFDTIDFVFNGTGFVGNYEIWEPLKTSSGF
jgi:hypothetical protein